MRTIRTRILDLNEDCCIYFYRVDVVRLTRVPCNQTNRHMKIKFLITCCVAVCLTVSASARAFDLVSQSEFLASQAEERLEPVFAARSSPLPSDPMIEIRSPSLTGPIKAPVSIDLRCLSSGAAKINWESLKIMYGAFKLDITERVRKEGKILSDGIQIASANLPSGSHKLVIQVANTDGKVAEREVRFTVE